MAFEWPLLMRNMPMTSRRRPPPVTASARFLGRQLSSFMVWLGYVGRGLSATLQGKEDAREEKRGIYHVPRKNAGNNIDATHTIRTTLRKEKTTMVPRRPPKSAEGADGGGGDAIETGASACHAPAPSPHPRLEVRLFPEANGLPGLIIRFPSAFPGTPVRVFPGMWMPLPTSRFRFPTPD